MITGGGGSLSDQLGRQNKIKIGGAHLAKTEELIKFEEYGGDLRWKDKRE